MNFVLRVAASVGCDLAAICCQAKVAATEAHLPWRHTNDALLLWRHTIDEHAKLPKLAGTSPHRAPKGYYTAQLLKFYLQQPKFII